MIKKNDTLNNENTDNFVNYRGRGTSPAELRSSGPKQRPEKVATTLGVRGESARRGVSSDENEYRCGGAYRAMLKLFADNLKNENNT
jgi:hypothetical protein